LGGGGFEKTDHETNGASRRVPKRRGKVANNSGGEVIRGMLLPDQRRLDGGKKKNAKGLNWEEGSEHPPPKILPPPSYSSGESRE